MRTPPAGIELVHFITEGAVPPDAQGLATTRFRHRTFFVGSDIRAAVKQGLAEYVPMSIARVPQLTGNGRVRAHVAPILTEGAQRFVGATTFSALASEPVQTSLFDERDPKQRAKLLNPLEAQKSVVDPNAGQRWVVPIAPKPPKP